VERAIRKPVSRRGFLTSVLGASGALVVGMELVPGLKWLDVDAAALTGDGSLGVYVTIAPDETITLTCPSAEMGQGVTTALPMIIAEELMVDWTRVRLHLGDYDPGLNRPTSPTTLGSSQSTGGSTAVRSYHDYLRTVGATTRQKLIWAASSLHPEIPVSDLKAVDGTVVQVSTGQVVATYGALAATAVGMSPNDVAWVQPPYRFIGKPVPRLDIPDKVNGAAVFGIDVRLPGMLYASVQQAPKVGQTVGSVGPTGPGVTAVPVPGGVAAIVDTTTWHAIRAARSLPVTWVDGPMTAECDSAAMKARAEGLLATGTALPVNPVVGDANGVLGAAPSTQRVTATYTTPYLAHATLEPMNATALVTDTACEVWAPTQVQTKAAQTAAAITGLPLSAVKVHSTFLGGGLGRRLEVDYVKQAVTAAMAVKGRPVKLVWSREEDFTHDVFRPASLVQMDAALDGSGNVSAIKARIVGPSIRTFQGSLTAGTADASVADGMVNAVYGFPHRLVEWVPDTIPIPVGWWRSIGVAQNCFVLESFLDEVALTTNQDPIQLRRNLCASGSALHNRVRTVLDTLATRSGWSTAPRSGVGRGMALAVGFGNTIVAQVAEVSGDPTRGYRVGRIVLVVDPGTVINPDTVVAQMEGAVHQGVQAALWQQQTFAAGAPVARNFDTYRMSRLHDMPVVEVTIVESGAALGGIGEPGLPPVAPAIANAIVRLGGPRVRSLPIAANLSATPTTTTTSTTTTTTTSTTTTAPTTTTTTTTTTRPPTTTTTRPSGLPTISSFTPSSGKVGTKVVLGGTGFTGTTAVKFNGTKAAFTVNSATKITATVPKGAKTGPISVTNAKGTATTRDAFSVG